MGFVDTSDIKNMLQDPELRADIAKAAAEDPGILDDLVDDIADELEDELENDAELKKQIIDAAMSNPKFKQKLIKELLDDLG